MNEHVNATGLVRPIIGRAEIQEVKDGWALFRVPIGRGDQRAQIQVADSREATVEAAEAALAISEKYFRARGANRAALDEGRRAALKTARAALNLGIADAQIERKVLGGGKGEKVNIALWDADEDVKEEDAEILAVVHTAGLWTRIPFDRDSRPLTFTRRRGRKIQSFQCHIVVTDTEETRPVEIWQLDREAPVRLAVSKAGGLEITVYGPQAEKTTEAATETEATAVTEVKAVPAEKGDGQEIIHCDGCHADVYVSSEALFRNEAKCPNCGTPIVVELMTILRDAELGLDEEKLNLLQQVGILHVEELAATDGGAVNQALGLTPRSKKGPQLVKAAQAYLEQASA